MSDIIATDYDEFDVISVGDTSIDDFIRLSDERIGVRKDSEDTWLQLPYGAKLPYESSTIVYGAGNAVNAAVNFAKLGLKGALITNLGSDENARRVVDNLDRRGVDTTLIKLNARKRTNYNYILWCGADRTILVNHEHYGYHWPHITRRETPKLLYLSSVAENAVELHDDIVEWLEAHPDVKLAFQPGTYQLKFGAERLKDIYARAEVLALNREEAVKVSGGDYDNIHDLFDKLHALGPRIILISDGPAGSYASDGARRLRMPVYPDVAPPVERTGCGDAYTSTFVASLIKGHDLESALQLAPISPASVVLYPGSQEGLLSQRQLREWLEKAPKDYKAEVL